MSNNRLYATNGFNFNPYPKTKKEREAYRADGKYKYDLNYHPPYRLYFLMPTIGYRSYLKNDNSITFSYHYLIDNFYGKIFFEELNHASWFGITYNLKI